MSKNELVHLKFEIAVEKYSLEDFRQQFDHICFTYGFKSAGKM